MLKKKKAKKNKISKMDGLGPLEKRKIKNALRDVWRHTHARALVVKRCSLGFDSNGDEYFKCETCKRKVPKIFVDHTIACGAVNDGLISRMFVPSKLLTGMCKNCHSLKTKEENALKKLLGD